MSMKRCEKGHYYDPDKHSSCPSCGVPDLNVGKTVPRKDVGQAPQSGSADTPTDKAGVTRRRGQPIIDPAAEGQTVGVFRKKTGIDPVVGWLVCIEGADRGRDYRIRSEKNFIGRSEKMQICIRNDESVSRENHAAVSFNPKKSTFKIHPGDSRGLVYLNDEDVDVPVELKPHDIIELGQTKLMFVPLCGEKFQWA